MGKYIHLKKELIFTNRSIKKIEIILKTIIIQRYGSKHYYFFSISMKSQQIIHKVNEKFTTKWYTKIMII